MDEQLNLFKQDKKNNLESHLPSDFFQINEISVKEEEKLLIQYRFGKCLFGNLIEASTEEGICYLAFYEDENQALIDFKKRFPKSKFSQDDRQNALITVPYFTEDWSELPSLQLFLKGTEFQLKVWKALLKIPLGKTTTYKDIASQIENPKANRAVGTAAGKNPIAFLIPCHRLLQTSGKIGGYRWGESRKLILLNWESEVIK